MIKELKYTSIFDLEKVIKRAKKVSEQFMSGEIDSDSYKGTCISLTSQLTDITIKESVRQEPNNPVSNNDLNHSEGDDA